MKRLTLTFLILLASVLLLPACQKVEKSYDSVSAQIQADQYFNDGEYNKAIEFYKQAISIDSDGILYYKLANAYEKIGDEKLALENLKKAEEKARFLHQEVTQKISKIDPNAEIYILNKASEIIEDEKKQAKENIEKSTEETKGQEKPE